MNTSKRISAFVFAALIAGTALAQSGGGDQLYKWKDSNGVTHYSQTPPDDKKFETRDIKNASVAATDPAKPGEKPKSEVQQNCEQAKNNLAQLDQANTQLMIDRDGDGKREAMTDEEKLAQKDLASRQVKAYCDDAAATAKN